MLVISKSISINLLDLESMGESDKSGFNMILKLFNAIDSEEKESENLKKLIYEAANADNLLMKKLRGVQEERYGEQGIAEVSYSTSPSNAVLVVGSNISELETVLEAL